MTQRSNSTIDRDHRRACEHRAWLVLQDLNSIDWNSVETYEIEEYIQELETLESELENESMCEQISQLLETLQELLD